MESGSLPRRESPLYSLARVGGPVSPISNVESKRSHIAGSITRGKAQKAAVLIILLARFSSKAIYGRD